MPDSTVHIGFSNGAIPMTTYGFRMIYDPTEQFFGAQQFALSDVVNVDTIFINSRYFLNDSTDTNDSLIVRVLIADPTIAPNPFSFFNLPISFTGLSSNITFPTLDYSGNANDGVHDGISEPITATFWIPIHSFWYNSRNSNICFSNSKSSDAHR